MYCPQCGRELDLDSGEVRFCRYCGFSLIDTKEALQGYSKQKRIGFSIVTWSYALLLLVTLLLHGNYIPLHTGSGYWLSALLIVVSVSFFGSAALSALKPAMFTKKKGALRSPQNTRDALGDARSRDASLLQEGPANVDQVAQERRTLQNRQPGSVVEDTTRRLGD